LRWCEPSFRASLVVVASDLASDEARFDAG
jgi:hypothetical protein